MPPVDPKHLGRSPRDTIAESTYRDYSLEIKPKPPVSSPPVKKAAEHVSHWKTLLGAAAALVTGGAMGGAVAAGPGAKLYVDKQVKSAVDPVASANITSTNSVLKSLQAYNDRLVTLEAIMPRVEKQNERIEEKIDKLNEKFQGPFTVSPLGPRGAR